MSLNPTLQLGLSAALKLFIAFAIWMALVYVLYQAGLVVRTKSQMHIFVIMVSMILYGAICMVWGIFLMLIKSFKPNMDFSPLTCALLLVLFDVAFILVLNIQDMDIKEFYTQQSLRKNILNPMLYLIGLGLIYFLVDISGLVDQLFGLARKEEK